MSKIRYPRTGICEMCKQPFEQYRPHHRFCKDNGCRKKRQKKRWDDWRERQEAAGTYRSTVNQYQRTFRQRTGYARDWELRTKYGITLVQWLDMVDVVDGKCEICGRGEKLCVDHDHQTGHIRGVLCCRCNRAIGQLGDREDGLEAAFHYLLRARLGWMHKILATLGEQIPDSPGIQVAEEVENLISSLDRLGVCVQRSTRSPERPVTDASALIDGAGITRVLWPS